MARWLNLATYYQVRTKPLTRKRESNISHHDLDPDLLMDPIDPIDPIDHVDHIDHIDHIDLPSKVTFKRILKTYIRFTPNLNNL